MVSDLEEQQTGLIELETGRGPIRSRNYGSIELSFSHKKNITLFFMIFKSISQEEEGKHNFSLV